MYNSQFNEGNLVMWGRVVGGILNYCLPHNKKGDGGGERFDLSMVIQYLRSKYKTRWV